MAINTHADKVPENRSQSVAHTVSEKQGGGKSAFQISDNRSEAVTQRDLQESTINSPRALRLKVFQSIVDVISPPIVQRITATPASVKLYISGGRVVNVVNTDTGNNLAFVMMDALPDSILEGTAVVSQTGKAYVVRFANDTVTNDQVGGLSKVKKVETAAHVASAGGGAAAAAAIDPDVMGSSSSSAKASKYALSPDNVDAKLPGKDSLFGKGMGLTGFEKEGGEDKGEDHFEKHGAEFDVKSKAEYIRMAQDLGRADGAGMVEATVKNTRIRFDPQTKGIVISSGKQIRTFYIWDQKYSDPVAYAIYYTITHNMGVPLSAVDPQAIAKFKAGGFDIIAMEAEYIEIGLKDGKEPGELQNETKAPMELIGRIFRHLLTTDEMFKMTVALLGGKPFSKPLPEADDVHEDPHPGDGK